MITVQFAYPVLYCNLVSCFVLQPEVYVFFLLIAGSSTLLCFILFLVLSPRKYVGAGLLLYLFLGFPLQMLFAWTFTPVVNLWSNSLEVYLFPLLLGTVLLLAIVNSGEDSSIEEYDSFILACVGLTLVCAGCFGLHFATTSPMFHSNEYASMLKVEEHKFSDDIPLASPEQIRLVPYSMAYAKATKALGQNMDGVSLGSQFVIDQTSAAVQEWRGGMYWVFPLDYKSISTWSATKGVPAYIRVSATNTEANAELVHFAAPALYTPGAYFSYNIDRLVWNDDPTEFLTERTAEITEDGDLLYVYSWVTPTIGFGGFTTKGVALVDPVRGLVNWIDHDIPKWIDRVKPMQQAVAQIDAWGSYSDGYWNARWTGLNLREASGNYAEFVRLGDHNYWFAGLTSVSNNDDSLLGMVFVDTQSTDNRAIIYTMSGNIEFAAQQAVISFLGANGAHWGATEAIPYNISGVPTYVIPVVATRTGLLQKVSLVSVGKISDLVVEDNLHDALRAYESKITENGNATDIDTSARTEISAGPLTILRSGMAVSGGNSTYYFLFSTIPQHIFTVQGVDKDTLVAPLLRNGDVVNIVYYDDKGMQLPLSEISLENAQE